MMKHYIVVMRHTRMHLVGPFDDHDTAANWGLANNPHDDPRWQTIKLEETPTMEKNPHLPLANGYMGVLVVRPEQAGEEKYVASP